MKNWLYASMEELIDMDYKEKNITGIVKWFNNKYGYGFIKCDDERDIFVHYSGIIQEGFKVLNEGKRVIFDVEMYDGDKLRATNVRYA